MKFLITKVVEVEANSKEDAKLKENTGYFRTYNVSQLHEQNGVGTELKILLYKFGLRPAKNCNCGKHIREMNNKGIEWCMGNIPVITGWLKEEASRAGLPFFETGAKIIIKRAIANAKRK